MIDWFQRHVRLFRIILYVDVRESHSLYFNSYIFVRLFCHVVSHWDDRNKINTILPFEWTVASRQRVTVKKEGIPTYVSTW